MSPETVTSWLTDPSTLRRLVATLLLLFAVIALRFVGKRAIDRIPLATEQSRLRWRVVNRNAWLAVFLLVGVVIWASELQSFAISVVAIAAALVLATKELILCLSGAVLRAGSSAYSVGDRVELGALRGDVIDISLLSTTLLEVGAGHQRTGRAITVPNSALLSGSVVNETFMEDYVVHVVRVPIDPAKRDWEQAERALLEAGRAASKDYVEPAKLFMDGLAKKHGLPIFSVEPRVHLAFAKADELQLLLRVPAPARERARVEQSVLRGYLARIARSADAED